MQDEILKAALLADFELFTRYFFKTQNGFKMQVKQFHKKLFDALTDVARGETKRLIITIPPRHGKTEIAVKSFIAWCLASNAASKFIHLSYSKNIALDNSRDIRELILSEEYSKIFGIALKHDSASIEKWYTHAGGGVYATAMAGQVTGFGAGGKIPRKNNTRLPAYNFGGAIIIDDGLKPDDAFSEKRRSAMNRRINGTVKSRLNQPQETPIIIIMQRLHTDDMAGFCLSGQQGDDWEHVNIPAIDGDRQSIWPEKITVADYEAMKQSDNYTFSSQYMQSPIILGGNIIKPSRFNYYDILPNKLEKRIITVDTAMKAGRHNDYTVAQCWGRADGRVWLIDQLRAKLDTIDIEPRIIAFWNKHKAMASPALGRLTGLYIEDAASGIGVIQQLNRTGGIPIVPIARKKSKYERVIDVINYIDAGLICIPKNADFTADFVAECEQFSQDDSHTHDDQIDSMIDAIDQLLATTNSWYNFGW